MRTWCLDRGKGLPTTTPPTTAHGKLNHLWWGRIPMEDVDKHILIRSIGLSALGKLDKTTIRLASQLEIMKELVDSKISKIRNRFRSM